MGEFKIPAADKGVAIIWQNGNKPVSVWGDPEKLRQVVFNLIDNALKYSPSGAIEIKLQSDEDSVELSVKDSGVGMSKETIERLFKKFSRGSEKELRTQGTGLGLYVAKRIIDDHKGEIWVESKGEGKGSIFYLKLATKNTRRKTQL
jgi:signal transduction histidine kinase